MRIYAPWWELSGAPERLAGGVMYLVHSLRQRWWVVTASRKTHQKHHDAK